MKTVIARRKGILIINSKDGNFFQFKNKTAFEYCLFKYQSTFTTIHLNDSRFYFKDFEVNENRDTLFESKKSIDFNVEEYRNKYY